MIMNVSPSVIEILYLWRYLTKNVYAGGCMKTRRHQNIFWENKSKVKNVNLMLALAAFLVRKLSQYLLAPNCYLLVVTK